MRRLTLANTLLFWMLLLALSFGQERRDPTVPSPAIQQRLGNATVDTEQAWTITLRAIVLGDPDHGTALVQTSSGMLRLRLDRQHSPHFSVEGTPYTVVDFNQSSLTIQRGTSQRTLSIGSGIMAAAKN